MSSMEVKFQFQFVKFGI